MAKLQSGVSGGASNGAFGAALSGGMAGLASVTLVGSLGVSLANVALPDLAGRFGAPLGTVKWVVVAYLLASTMTVLGAGRLGDRLGHGRVLRAGLWLFALASLLSALAPSLWLLALARAVQGVAAAAMLAQSLVLAQALSAGGGSGRAMGLMGSMSAIGTALGPSLGGLVLEFAGWRAMFLLPLPLAILGWWLCRGVADGTRRMVRERFDRTGFALIGVAIAFYALALDPGGAALRPWRAALAGGAVVAGLGFLVWQRRAAAPLLNLGLLASPGRAAGLVTNGLVAAIMMATLVVGPFYLSGVHGLSVAEVGLVLAAGPALSMASGVPAGHLADRLGTGGTLAAGLATMCAGTLALALLPGWLGLPGYFVGIALLTPGYQAFQAANNAGLMAGAPAEARGAVAGLVTLSRNLGLITGASAMSGLFARGAGTSDLLHAGPDALVQGFQLTFLVAGGLVALSLLAAAGARASEGTERQPPVSQPPVRPGRGP